MTDTTDVTAPSRSLTVSPARTRRRHAAERRFRLYGQLAIALALGFLALLLGSMLLRGLPAFTQTEVALDVHFDPTVIDPDGRRDPQALSRADYGGLVKQTLRDRFPEVTGRSDRRKLNSLLSIGAPYKLREMVLEDPALIGRTATVWLLASDDIDQLVKGNLGAGEGGRVSALEARLVGELQAAGRLERNFNTRFFTSGDSREPELAGILGAAVGSLLTLLVCLALAFPLAVMAAVYLEEFARKNRWSELIEVNINNLAAVPSIVFGLLGLALFLNVFGLPRSAPLVGGMVLALMTLPTIIIAARASLGAVPPSIREAALGMGASRMQVVLHHVLPLALPGILTGTIIGMARALGETAPLLMIGMVAFIVDVPQGVTDPATVLPVQIFLWADSPERAFVERTSAATLVLIGFLILMNLAAVLLRKRFERRW